jgi:dTDP-4-amino-4,6-dideoxygalactose transaminase
MGRSFMNPAERVNVTKTFLPPMGEYQAYLDKIWETAYLTNQGPLLQEFEEKTEEYLNVDNFHFVTNGTLALMVAIKALGITEGEIITTPFSYVATTSAILWERCTPVYVDIEPDTFCIDADKIEAAITKDTKAILAVHVFGNPCDVEKIQAVADKHQLKVIYDAAHAFGVEYKGKSLFSYGDISIGSFHATKLFHTIEGGGIFVNNPKYNDIVELTKRFGHQYDEHYMLGINAKASEFQAAMGLCNLKYVTGNIAKRKDIFSQYNEHLVGSGVELPRITEGATHNYSYYPVVFENEELLMKAVKRLNDHNIFPRRYFFPSLNRLPYVQSSQDCSVSEDIAKRILCLPLYPDLEKETVSLIGDIINSSYVAA